MVQQNFNPSDVFFSAQNFSRNLRKNIYKPESPVQEQHSELMEQNQIQFKNEAQRHDAYMANLSAQPDPHELGGEYEPTDDDHQVSAKKVFDNPEFQTFLGGIHEQADNLLKAVQDPNTDFTMKDAEDYLLGTGGINQGDVKLPGETQRNDEEEGAM